MSRFIVVPIAILLAVIAATPWDLPPSSAERVAAAEEISFERHALPDSNGNQEVRPVQPQLDHIARWISAVGASVGTFDLRGQGIDADGCLTDPRDDKLRVFPVPGSPGREFQPFELDPTISGLRYDRTMAPIGCVPADINEDGKQDVIAYYWGRSPVIYLNRSRPVDQPSAAAFHAIELVEPMAIWNTTALNVADVDGDGHLDIFVGNYFPDGARVLDENAKDDPRMQMQHSMGAAKNAGTNRLYLGHPTKDGAISFTDVSDRLPADSAASWTLATGFQDLTDNGLPDVYVANDFGPDQLLLNESKPGDVQLTPIVGDRTLTTPKSKVLGRDSFKGMGVAYSYEPNQELPRILISNITSPWALQESNLAFIPDGSSDDLLEGDFPYREDSEDLGLAHSGWSWDIKPIDPTNSGHDSFIQATGFIQGTRDIWPRLQEIAMGNDQILENPGAWMRIEENDDLSGHEPDRMWIPYEDGYLDVGQEIGFSPDDVTRGFSVADVNGDAKQDFLTAQQWGRSYAFINHSDPGNPAMTLRVVKPTTGQPTPLIGATVTLQGAGGYTRETQLFPGNGHSGVSGAGLHFAVPQDALRNGRIEVQVDWTEADGRHTQTFDVEVKNKPIQLKVK